MSDFAEIPGGSVLVGTRDPQIPYDGESPVRSASLSPFRIGKTAVSNAEFSAFVAETGYVTEAERIGWSFVFHAQVPQSIGATASVPEASWWRQVYGANWRNINGPDAADAYHDTHPVVQVSWNDARAYATWMRGRLPTEAEWEHAARGGLEAARFPWGNEEPNDHDTFPCNIWQGDFPNTNTVADGYDTTAPVTSYAPNGYGLYNMSGNVWEWTSEPFTIRSMKKQVKAKLRAMKGFKLSKGGSFLCHRSYCYRYRIAGRSGTSPDSATTHHGFRIVLPV